jgi:hypothetical protein
MSEAAFCGRHRRGSILIYTFYLMVIMLAFVSFGVDFGRMELTKTELQRDADACARGALQMYLTYGSSVASAYTPLLGGEAYNPVDAKSGTVPTIVVTWGSWSAQTKTFTPGGTSPIAVRVTISRTTATGNPMKLTFPLINGVKEVRTTCDVWAQSVAVLNGGSSATVVVSGQSDPWLAGMPSGAEASDLDYAPSQSPPMVMNVTPGTVLTFTNISGGVAHDPTDSNDTAAGNSSEMHSHNDDDPMNEPAVQNGVGNVTAPIDCLIGLFLTNNAPNTQPAPTVSRDYSTAASRSAATTSDLQLQQPFYVGTGQTASSTTQTFVVPAGATRLYLGTMDGHQWSNNSGSFTVTINQQQSIQLVQ